MVADRPSFQSVRSRITAIAAVAVVVGLTATAVGLVQLVRGDLSRTLDVRLALELDRLEALGGDVAALSAAIEGRGGDEYFAQYVVADAVVVATSNMDGQPAAYGDTIRAVFDIEVAAIDDGGFRVHTRASGDAVLVVGRTLDDVRDGVAALWAALAIGIPVLAIGLASLVWILVGRTLRPVEAIRSEVAGMSGDGDLDRRVPVPETMDEIGRLAHTMNELLGRIEHATDRQRAFVGDASHELRTPLTRLRTQLEVDGGTDPAGLLEEVVGLQRLVEDLLYLARADAGSVLIAEAPVALDEVVCTVVDDPGAGPVELKLESVIVSGSEDQLRRMVRNLVENAVRHADSSVVVRLSREGGDAVLEVADDGDGIPVGDRERVFQRFVRLDESRTMAEGGSGLGLAIVREIVTAHRGTVEVGPAPTGTVIMVRLPVG